MLLTYIFVLRAQSRFLKCVLGSACGITPTNFKNLLWAQSTLVTDRITNNIQLNLPQRSPMYKGHLPITASFLLSLRFSLYNESLYNGPCLTHSAATINVPLHIDFPVYNGHSCMSMINIPIDVEFISMVATVDNYLFWLLGN